MSEASVDYTLISQLIYITIIFKWSVMKKVVFLSICMALCIAGNVQINAADSSDAMFDREFARLSEEMTSSHDSLVNGFIALLSNPTITGIPSMPARIITLENIDRELDNFALEHLFVEINDNINRLYAHEPYAIPFFIELLKTACKEQFNKDLKFRQRLHKCMDSRGDVWSLLHLENTIKELYTDFKNLREKLRPQLIQWVEKRCTKEKMTNKRIVKTVTAFCVKFFDDNFYSCRIQNAVGENKKWKDFSVFLKPYQECISQNLTPTQPSKPKKEAAKLESKEPVQKSEAPRKPEAPKLSKKKQQKQLQKELALLQTPEELEGLRAAAELAEFEEFAAALKYEQDKDKALQQKKEAEEEQQKKVAFDKLEALRKQGRISGERIAKSREEDNECIEQRLMQKADQERMQEIELEKCATTLIGKTLKDALSDLEHEKVLARIDIAKKEYAAKKEAEAKAREKYLQSLTPTTRVIHILDTDGFSKADACLQALRERIKAGRPAHVKLHHLFRATLNKLSSGGDLSGYEQFMDNILRDIHPSFTPAEHNIFYSSMKEKPITLLNRTREFIAWYEKKYPRIKFLYEKIERIENTRPALRDIDADEHLCRYSQLRRFKRNLKRMFDSAKPPYSIRIIPPEQQLIGPGIGIPAPYSSK
jgi:hypothetical protein